MSEVPSSEKVDRPVPWQFWIDVGGTFTDCIARSPSGEVRVWKVLSSAVVKGRVREVLGEGRIADPALGGFARDFFVGYRLRLFDANGTGASEREIEGYEPERGVLDFTDAPGAPLEPGTRFEIVSGEPAPILAIRKFLGLRLRDAIGPVDVRLGTTRGTNALLERTGARTAFVTTRGFADVLRIANQDRPKLFDLEIRKPSALFSEAVEVPGRIAADGTVLEPIDREVVRERLARLKRKGFEAVAVALMNAYKNPEHERVVGQVAERLGFDQVSLSSVVSPTIKIVSRGDTTVVDAYLSPVIRDYVRSIREKIGEGRLMLMTSAGGLVEAEALAGKDTILSGPAGGVVGFSGVARAAGFHKAIGFDMGGTSTDVSRFEGEFEYEYETRKAGVRIVAPMLAIETVAAGGGSVCDFDGQKLTVGPRSAGADPGPACYGRGGPLTVTDANLYLGRLAGRFFPFELERGVVEERLAELAMKIERATGQSLTPERLAEGFVRIANASMSAAIKKISVARGYDVRDYALVCFGGAAGQHATAIARSLGISKVLAHRYAGVLSAYGMGMADVKRFAVKTVLAEYGPRTLAEVERELKAMEARLREEVRSEGIAEERIGPARRRLELRYLGQGSAIAVPEREGEDWAESFERLHRRLYGHTFQRRPLEIVAARVEVTGAMEKPEVAVVRETEGAPEAKDWTQLIDGGRRVRTPVFQRADFQPGYRIDGPAIVIEPTATTYVEEGWECAMTARGDLLLTDRAGAPAAESVSKEADPIALEIFNHQFAAIAEQMGVTLRRTALSVNVKERLDYSCAVFTPEGDLVANAPHMPVHLGAMSECVKRIIEDVKTIEAGDVIATNDPMRGGSHLPDVTIVTPVFEENADRIAFFTASRAHHAEIGGIRPGSMPPDSTSLAEEGVLVRNFKVLQAGRPRFDELRALLTSGAYPSRAPEENLADVGAQIAANQNGVANLRAMIERYGLETTHAYMRHIQRAAENKMRAALGGLDDGNYEFTDEMDSGARIKVKITIAGEGAKVDFTGTSPRVEGNLNANRAIVKAAIIYCFRLLIDEDIPLNQGVLAPIELELPECFLNPRSHEDARECPAVVGGNVETSQRIVDVILGALSMAAASQGTMNNLTFGNERFGYYETICGGAGAGPGFDGADAVHTHMTNTRLTDPEVLEARYPVRLRRFEIRQGSGGKGERRGGNGVTREIEFLEPLEVSILSSRRVTRPFGLAGGEAGKMGRNLLVRARDGGGEEEPTPQELAAQVTFQANAGDRLTIMTPGGGGWGSA